MAQHVKAVTVTYCAADTFTQCNESSDDDSDDCSNTGKLFMVAVCTSMSVNRTHVTYEDMTSNFRGRSAQQHSSACAGGGGTFRN